MARRRCKDTRNGGPAKGEDNARLCLQVVNELRDFVREIGFEVVLDDVLCVLVPATARLEDDRHERDVVLELPAVNKNFTFSLWARQRVCRRWQKDAR
jgi:hypothetical protein